MQDLTVLKKSKLVPPCNQNLYKAQDYVKDHKIERLPKTLAEALSLAESSTLVQQVIPERVANLYIQKKRVEWQQYLHAENRAEDFYRNTFLLV